MKYFGNRQTQKHIKGTTHWFAFTFLQRAMIKNNSNYQNYVVYFAFLHFGSGVGVSIPGSGGSLFHLIPLLIQWLIASSSFTDLIIHSFQSGVLKQRNW